MTVTSSKNVKDVAYRAGSRVAAGREVPVEMPVAFSYGGSSHAVMMATPANLEDFAIGFSLAEGIIQSASEIKTIEIVDADRGIDLQILLSEDRASRFQARRRAMAGPVGCGLCGVESIDEALKPVSRVSEPDFALDPKEIERAMSSMASDQPLFAETRAVHAAAFYVPGEGVIEVREDVGRHNALDKLCGALARQNKDPSSGVILMTSRVSVELIQKAARAGCGYLVAVSAPTSLAIEMAEAAGICLIAIARGSDFEIFTHAERVSTGEKEGVSVHVA